MRLGEIRRATEVMHEAKALAERLKDDRRRARACIFAPTPRYFLGEMDVGRAACNQALDIAR